MKLSPMKYWKSLKPEYKVFIVVFTMFILLSPGALVVIDEPADLLKIITNKATADEVPLLIKSVIQSLFAIAVGKDTPLDVAVVSGMKSVFVHAVIAGLVASMVLKA